MFKKLWLMALSTIVLWSPLLWIASADSTSYSFVWSTNTYSPNSLTVSNDSSISNVSYSVQEACSEYDFGETCWFYVVNSSHTQVICRIEVSDWELQNDGCSNSNISAWQYAICSDPFCWEYPDYATNVSFPSISFNLNYTSSWDSWDSSSWWSDSDWSISVPSWFTDSVNWLVSNFAWSIWNYAPTLIIVWLGVVLLFTFWWVIRSWAVRILSKKWR